MRGGLPWPPIYRATTEGLPSSGLAGHRTLLALRATSPYRGSLSPRGRLLVEVHHGRKNISSPSRGHDGAARRHGHRGADDAAAPLVHKDGAYYIVYKETEATGYEGCTTTVKVADDARKVSMLRFGKQTSQLVIEKGTRHLCHYETGYGAISLGVSADVIEHALDENGGKLQFSYIAGFRCREFHQPESC